MTLVVSMPSMTQPFSAEVAPSTASAATPLLVPTVLDDAGAVSATSA